MIKLTCLGFLRFIIAGDACIKVDGRASVWPPRSTHHTPHTVCPT